LVPSARRTRLSRGFDAGNVVCESIRSGLGSLRSPDPPFSKCVRAMSRLTVHSILLEIELILPRFAPPQSSFTRSPRRSRFHGGPTCRWVSFPLRDITREQLRFFARPPEPRFGPSAGFRNLSTASSALSLAGLFHPATTSRVRCRSGASLPSQRAFFVRRRLPPCRCCIAARQLVSKPRPRTMPLDFEAFIPRRAAFFGFGYSPGPKPLPSSNFLLLQVLAPRQ